MYEKDFYRVPDPNNPGNYWVTNQLGLIELLLDGHAVKVTQHIIGTPCVQSIAIKDKTSLSFGDVVITTKGVYITVEEVHTIKEPYGAKEV